MPWQLLYTSAPRLLTAGQTGFGTVARHREIPPLVVSAVERASQFARLQGMDAARVVYCHRIVDAAGARHHVLSRTASAGADYTGRTNHLAHHVILTAAEAAELAARGVSAADVALRFPWQHAWHEAARWLENHETPALAALPHDRHEHLSAWMEATGNPQHANHLVTGNGARSGCIVIAPARVDMRRLYAEALRGVPEQGWQFPFTTELDPGDAPTDFRWMGFSPGSPVLTGLQPGRRLVLDLTRPASLPVAEPLPEKAQAPAAASGTGRRTSPPRVAAPAGGAFVEPPVEIPSPLLAQTGGMGTEAEPTSPRRRQASTSEEDHGGMHGWRIVGLIFAAACVVLGITLFVAGKWPTLDGGREIVEPEVSQGSRVKPEPRPSPSPAPPAPVPSKMEPSPVAGGPTSVPPTVSIAPVPNRPPVTEAIVPLRAAHAAQLGLLNLPQLRIDQTHFLITTAGEERGPLFESRNNLSLSLSEPAPVLKLDYTEHRAAWSAAPDSVMAPPVQWRVLKDGREILRVLIGDGSQRQPLNATPVPAAQDESGAVTGAFATLVRRFGDQALWLRLPPEALTGLRECGYEGPALVPLRSLRADTSDVLSWVVKEQTRLQGVLSAPVPESPLPGTMPKPLAGDPNESSAAPRSKQANNLDNRPSPTSSVAGSMGAVQEQMRAAAQKRLDKLSELRGSSLLKGRLPPGACSFLAGPASSKPEHAVWVCDVAFATPSNGQ